MYTGLATVTSSPQHDKVPSPADGFVDMLSGMADDAGLKYVVAVHDATANATHVYYSPAMANCAMEMLRSLPTNENISVHSLEARRQYDETLVTHPLALGEVGALTEYLLMCFDALQQLTCKALAKLWIKELEPKKQTRFPYNRGDRSKPKWWPADVRHREPDHLMKGERTRLLVALCTTPHAPVAKFRRSSRTLNLEGKKRRIVDEVLHVLDARTANPEGVISVVDIANLVYRRPSSAPRSRVSPHPSSASMPAYEQPPMYNHNHMEMHTNGVYSAIPAPSQVSAPTPIPTQVPTQVPTQAAAHPIPGQVQARAQVPAATPAKPDKQYGHYGSVQHQGQMIPPSDKPQGLPGIASFSKPGDIVHDLSPSRFLCPTPSSDSKRSGYGSNGAFQLSAFLNSSPFDISIQTPSGHDDGTPTRSAPGHSKGQLSSPRRPLLHLPVPKLSGWNPVASSPDRAIPAGTLKSEDKA